VLIRIEGIVFEPAKVCLARSVVRRQWAYAAARVMKREARRLLSKGLNSLTVSIDHFKSRLMSVE
jgi:hypothetical protein